MLGLGPSDRECKSPRTDHFKNTDNDLYISLYLALAAESPKITLLGAAPKQPASFKSEARKPKCRGIPTSEGRKDQVPQFRIYWFLISFGLRFSAFGLLLGPWQKSDAPALQAGLNGSVTRRSPPSSKDS